jgi:hypothetical protein
MQMLLGGQANGLASMGNLKDRLAQLAQSNPQLAPLAQQLQNRFFAAPMSVEEVHGENSDESDSLVEPEILDPVDAPHAKHRKLETLAKRMYSELKVMRGRNRRLAEALGACHFCWGDDQSCEYCSGDGGIGAFQINPKVFTEVVGPAMQQVRQRPPLAKSQTTNKGEGNHAGL